MSSPIAPPAAAGDAASHAHTQSAAQPAAAAAGATPPAVTLPPPSFLAMTETKRQHSEAIALYYSHQHALTAARDDLTRFNATCGKNAPLISLPHSLGAGFSQVRFVAVDGDAAFYKEQLDALKTLEQESAKAAFALIVAGKKKYISHLESLVKTQTFVSRAISTYSNFVNEINRLYAARGSSTTVPLDVALLHFETKLRREMESYDAQQIQAALEASRKKKDSADEEMAAQERIASGSHDGTNIAQIAGKAAKAQLAETGLVQKLATANSNITRLQEQINRLTGAKVVNSSAAPNLKTAKSQGTKRKGEQQKPRAKSPAAPKHDDDAMSDEPTPAAAAAATPAKQSNSQGGGRTQHQSKKHKSGRDGRSGGKSTDQSKDKQKKE